MTNLELITNAFTRKDQKKLWVPQHILDDKELEIRPVITWMHSQLPIGYVIYNDGDVMTGITLSLFKSKEKQRPTAHMCDFCLQSYSSSQVSMFSYQKTPDLSIGFYACSDLACEHRIMDPDFTKLYSTRETLSKPEKVSRYYGNVQKFFQKHVGPRSR